VDILDDLAMEGVSGEVALPGSVETPQRVGSDGYYAVLPAASAHQMRARLALVGAGDPAVSAVETAVEVNDELTLPAGSWTVAIADLDEDVMEAWAGAHGLHVYRIRPDVLEDVTTHEVDLPRIALLHTWSRTQDEGWARFTLDQQGVAYDYVGEDRLADLAPLRDRYDVILFPHQGRGATGKRILQGVDPSNGPIAYTRTAEFPSHGTPDSSPDITGGMGFEGLMALREFVEEGGTFITVGSASSIPVDFGFLRDVNTRPAGSVFVPGSILQGTVVDPENPLTYGYGDTLPLYHQSGPYFNISNSAPGSVAVRYQGGEGMLLSGVARGAGSLGGQPAVYGERIGEGAVVIYGFDALHRHQNHGNHALVWNAILHWNDLPRAEE
jgi:hypothetical protein